MKMYLADNSTNECRGIYEAAAPKAGTYDTEVAFTDSRQIFTGDPGTGSWDLSNADKEADERAWRADEFMRYDQRMQIRRNQLDRGDAAEAIAPLDTWATALKDMPTLTGFPDSHVRPVEP